MTVSSEQICKINCIRIQKALTSHNSSLNSQGTESRLQYSQIHKKISKWTHRAMGSHQVAPRQLFTETTVVSSKQCIMVSRWSCAAHHAAIRPPSGDHLLIWRKHWAYLQHQQGCCSITCGFAALYFASLTVLSTSWRDLDRFEGNLRMIYVY